MRNIQLLNSLPHPASEYKNLGEVRATSTADSAYGREGVNQTTEAVLSAERMIRNEAFNLDADVVVIISKTYESQCTIIGVAYKHIEQAH